MDRFILFLGAALLSSSLPSQIHPEGSLLLQIEGRPGAVRLVHAWRKARAFPVPRKPRAGGRILVLDARGKLLEERPLDLDPFDFDATGGSAHVVLGDTLRSREIGLLIKIGDFGRAMDRVEIRGPGKGGERVLGRISRGEILKVLQGTAGPALAPIVKTQMKNGPVGNRYDIVILGDGYRASEEARFYLDVKNWMADLFGREPFKTYKSFFNVHTVFRASAQSGADHPDRKPPIYKNTAYDASYNTGGTPRCLYIKNGTLARADAALAPDVEGRIVVFVNDSRYGGCAGTFAVSYNGSSSRLVQSHEFGHSFGGLADEYSYGRPGTYRGPEPRQPNLTKDSTGKTKWPLWIGTNGIGAYQGAGYYRYGLYRPKLNCLMRALSAPLCEICVEECSKRNYAKVNPIENPIPSSSSLKIYKPRTKVFTFTNLTPGGGTITWLLDGKPVQQGGTTYTLLSSGLTAGNHSLKVEVKDKTAFVRKDPTKTLVHSRTWSLSVVDRSKFPDLVVSSITAPTSAPAGSTIKIVTVLSNSGGGSSGPFRSELFLSKDALIGTQDIYLGASTVTGLALNGTTTITRNVAIPLFALPGTWTLGAWVDRANIVEERNETNNKRTVSLNLGAYTGCPASPEFHMPLAYPTNSYKISIISGGTARLDLTAPCRKGDYYLLLWSGKGTSPGVRLPGNHLLPLNWDPVLTPFGLATLNLYPFRGTFGKIGTSGQGRADLFIPPVKIFTPLSTHFAAIFFDPAFRKVTGTSTAAALGLPW